MDDLDLQRRLVGMRSECEDLYVAAREKGLNNVSNLLVRVLGGLSQTVPECRAERVAMAKKPEGSATKPQSGE